MTKAWNATEPLDNADLGNAEEMAFAGDTQLHRCCQALIREHRRLGHELADPRFMYTAGRATRDAILCRNAEIEHLRVELKGRDKPATATPPRPVGSEAQRCFDTMTNSAHDALVVARLEADRRNHPFVNVGHLLIALFESEQGGELLRSIGLAGCLEAEKLGRRIGDQSNRPAPSTKS